MRLVRRSGRALEQVLAGCARLEPTYAGPDLDADAGAEPAGFHRVRVRERIGAGPDAFARASAQLLGWGMHRDAGLDVVATEPTAAPGVTVVTCLRVGPVGVPAPCRVARVTDTPAARGFAYRTLPGHPETGEEAFTVELDDAGAVWVRIEALSRPAGFVDRLGQPVARQVQALVIRRYVAAFHAA